MARGRVSTRGHRSDGESSVSVVLPPPAALGHEVPGATVVREALLAGLGDSPRPVVVLSAPAGAGKSTLLRQWASRDSRPHLELRAGPAVDDPAALAWRLIDLLEPLGGAVEGSARTAVTASEPGFSAVLLPMLTWLASAAESSYVLAIDDAHLLTHPACHQILAAVAEGVPIGSCLALAMRTAPPPWLSRVRAQGALLEVGPASFAFSDEETAELLAGFGLRADPDSVRDVREATEGWAVGLYLTALSSADRDHASSEPAAVRAHRFVGDYLRVEVLDLLDEDDLRFVTRTAVLDELTGPLCDAVVADSGSEARLASLHRRVRLIIPTGNNTFRYHHLLAEAAVSVLRAEEPDLEPELHRRAAQWYGDHGQLDAAIRHAKASGDLALTAHLVWLDVPANVGGSRAEQLRYRLAGLTDAQLASDRWLSLEACWMHLQAGDVDQATRWLLTSQAHVGADWREQVRRDPYAAQVALPTALVGSVGLAETVALCDDALNVLSPNEPLRCGLMWLRGASLTLLRDLRGGLETLEQAERTARALDVPVIIADSLAFRGVVALLTGDAATAAALIAAGTDVIRTARLDRLATAMHTLTAQSLLQAMRGDPEAEQTLAHARRMTVAASGITTWFQVVGRLVQARAATLLGDGATARILVVEARERMTPELRPSLAWDLLTDTEAALLALSATGVAADSLTTAELRILQFLPSHLSFRQIGEHLFLSPNTVKTHAMAIYRKFGVSSRAAAVDRARTLGLVEPAVVGSRTPR